MCIVFRNSGSVNTLTVWSATLFPQRVFVLKLNVWTRGQEKCGLGSTMLLARTFVILISRFLFFFAVGFLHFCSLSRLSLETVSGRCRVSALNPVLIQCLEVRWGEVISPCAFCLSGSGHVVYKTLRIETLPSRMWPTDDVTPGLFFVGGTCPVYLSFETIKKNNLYSISDCLLTKRIKILRTTLTRWFWG